jgi:hypothetical protein
MKPSIRCLALAACVLLPLPAALGGNACPLSDPNDLQFNGTAVLVEGGGPRRLRLTANAFNQVGSVFSRTPIRLDLDFSTQFDFWISGSGGVEIDGSIGADGLAMVLSPDPAALGFGGGGMGYAGMPAPSLAVEVDSWANGEYLDIDGNHAGINLDGNNTSLVSAALPFPLLDGAYRAWIDYQSQRLEVRFAAGLDPERPAAPLLSFNIDLEEHFGSRTAFLGFSAGTGGAFANHEILAWSVNPRSSISVDKADMTFAKSAWRLAVKKATFNTGLIVLNDQLNVEDVYVVASTSSARELFFRVIEERKKVVVKYDKRTNEVQKILIQGLDKSKLLLDFKQGRMQMTLNGVPNPEPGSNLVNIELVVDGLRRSFPLGGTTSGRNKILLQPAVGELVPDACP